MTKPRKISIEEEKHLRSIFRYDPTTGYLFRRVGPYILKERKVGTPVGRGSYLQVSVGYNAYYVHRVIWFLQHGTWPDVIDHKDKDTWNNKLDNLREATHSQNQANRDVRFGNQVGLKGVIKVGNKFTASITINRKQKHIGVFLTKEDAFAAYKIEANKLYGEFAHGF